MDRRDSLDLATSNRLRKIVNSANTARKLMQDGNGSFLDTGSRL
jgi:hypothetical protein